MARIGRAAAAFLDERLVALREALDAGDDVIDPAALEAGRLLLVRAGERLGHGAAHTVVALAGATGSGKSSLFNALAGSDLSAVGVRRPTTSTTHACSWGDADPLLDWLGIDRRHRRPEDDDLGGLVLLDLPDHDSTALAHRAEVDRVVAVADVVVWVLDPQKYADRAVHERYLRPLSHHAGALLVLLHQADRLPPAELAACRADLARLLAADGLGAVEPVTTSVRTPGGLDALRGALARLVGERRAAVTRLEADLDALGDVLSDLCGGSGASGVAVGDERRVVDALVEAAGVPVVTAAVAGSHRARAVAATGWPATRWLRRLRPDPLRRLHLGAGTSPAARTSLPVASAVSSARVDTAVRTMAAGCADGLALPWADAVAAAPIARLGGLAAQLDEAVAAVDLGDGGRPRWWRVAGALQAVATGAVVLGALWLAVLFGLSYLQLDDLATPEVGRLPVPTALVLGGVLAGLALALVARVLASAGAGRRARRAGARLRASIEAVARREVLGPVEEVLERRARCCAALARASGR